MALFPAEDADFRERLGFLLPGHVGIAVGGTIGATVASSSLTAAGITAACGVVGFLVSAALWHRRDEDE